MNFTNATIEQQDIGTRIAIWWDDWRYLQVTVYPFAIAVLIFECVLVICANLVIIMSSFYLYGRTSAPLTCIYSLAFADIWFAVLTGTTLFLNSLLPSLVTLPLYWTCYMYATEALKMGAIMTTIYHLLALAVSHYIVTAHPWTHEDKLARVTVPMLALTWLLPPAMYFTIFLLHFDETFAHPNCQITFLHSRQVTLATILGMALPMVLMCALYGRLLRTALKAARPGGSTARKIKNLALTSALLIIGTVVVCWMPSGIMFAFFDKDARFDYPPLLYLSIMILISALYISKGLLNPFIYAVRVPDIKMALRRMCCSRERFRQMSLQTGYAMSPNECLLHHNDSNQRTLLKEETNNVHMKFTPAALVKIIHTGEAALRKNLNEDKDHQFSHHSN